MLDLKCQLADGGLTLFDKHINRRLRRRLGDVAVVVAFQTILLLAQARPLERFLYSPVSHGFDPAFLLCWGCFAVPEQWKDRLYPWAASYVYVPEQCRRKDGGRIACRAVMTFDGGVALDASAGMPDSALIALDIAAGVVSGGVL